jgi:HK97 family phage portal protein
MDLWQWKWMVIFTLALRGNSFHYITGRDSEGNPTGLMPLHPDLVFVQRRVNILEWYDPIYRVMGDRIPSCDMIHIRRYTVPGQPIGLTPIQQMAHSIGVNLSAQQYGLRYFKDSANPSSVLKTDQSLPDDEIERVQKEWVSTHGGRRLPAVLSGGFDWKPITINPEESQFLETLRYSRSDISMFFGVPPHMIGDVDRSTSWGTGIEQMSLGFNTYTLGGWTSCFESAFSALLPKNHFVRFDPSVLMRTDVKSRYESYQAARNTGWLSINEIRQREELPPVEDGDGYLQPLNYGPLGAEPSESNPDGQAPDDAPDHAPGQEPPPPSAGAPSQEGY